MSIATRLLSLILYSVLFTYLVEVKATQISVQKMASNGTAAKVIRDYILGLETYRDSNVKCHFLLLENVFEITLFGVEMALQYKHIS